MRSLPATAIAFPWARQILCARAAIAPLNACKQVMAEVMARVKAAAICEAHRVPLPAAAQQFPLVHPTVAAIIPGVPVSSSPAGRSCGA